MNKVAVQGYIRDIEFSHDIGNVDYSKASLICPGVNGKEDDLFHIQFKTYQNQYKEGDFISFVGNLRSYNQRQNNKSSVMIYIFTYFDLPDIPVNTVQLDGRICKKDILRTTRKNKSYLHFILANNILKGNKKINSYIPCTAYGEQAKKLDLCNINDIILVNGEFHSHTFKQKVTKEIKLAHEVIVNDFKLIEGEKWQKNL